MLRELNKKGNLENTEEYNENNRQRRGMNRRSVNT